MGIELKYKIEGKILKLRERKLQIRKHRHLIMDKEEIKENKETKNGV